MGKLKIVKPDKCSLLKPQTSILTKISSQIKKGIETKKFEKKEGRPFLIKINFWMKRK